MLVGHVPIAETILYDPSMCQVVVAYLEQPLIPVEGTATGMVYRDRLQRTLRALNKLLCPCSTIVIALQDNKSGYMGAYWRDATSHSLP